MNRHRIFQTLSPASHQRAIMKKTSEKINAGR
jgi:hypothetical protein